jgi:glucokinase
LHETAGASPAELEKIMQHADPAAAISTAAGSGDDLLARAALDMFVSIYGAQAGNLALLNLAFGGVYIAGGIAPKILNHITSGAFMRAFANKGRMSALLGGVPVYVIVNPKVGLMGAATAAARF